METLVLKRAWGLGRHCRKAVWRVPPAATRLATHPSSSRPGMRTPTCAGKSQQSTRICTAAQRGAASPGGLIAGSAVRCSVAAGPSSRCADAVRPAPAPTPPPAHACSQHHACRKAQGGRQELGRGQLDAEDNAGACNRGGSRVSGRGGALCGMPHARRAPARRQPCAVQAGCSTPPPRTHLCRWPGRRPRPWRRPRLRGSSAGRGGVLGGHWLGAAHAAFLRAWRAANWLGGLAYTAVGHHRAVCAGPGWCVSGGWEAGCAGAQGSGLTDGAE